MHGPPRGGDRYIELRVPVRPEFVSVIRSMVTDLAERIRLPASSVEDVQVAVSEACANVVRHAYPQGVSDGENTMLVRCSADDDKITTEVIDKGCGFDGCFPRRSRDCEGGFGLILIKTLMDQVQFSSSPDAGTMIRMVKFARRPADD